MPLQLTIKGAQGVAVQVVPPDDNTLLIDDGSGTIPVYAAAVLKQRQHSLDLTAYLGQLSAIWCRCRHRCGLQGASS